jgi:hypothetical protein
MGVFIAQASGAAAAPGSTNNRFPEFYLTHNLREKAGFSRNAPEKISVAQLRLPGSRGVIN